MRNHYESSQFLDVPEGFNDYRTSRVVVWPVPFERTTSWGKGTARGPEAILEASTHVEYYDEELDFEPFKVGIHTLPEPELSGCTTPEGLTKLRDSANKLLTDDKFILTLGGEHTISTPIISAAQKKHSDLSVLQIDAHADLRNTYEGSKHSHACVMRRVSEICPIVQVGIRSISKEEKDIAQELPTTIFFAREISKKTDWIKEVVQCLSEHVYLTIDVDGLEPSIMPSTGTPEPGGIGWHETLELIHQISRTRRIVSADIVELAPINGLHAPDFLCAKLGYKIIGYVFEQMKGQHLKSGC